MPTTSPAPTPVLDESRAAVAARVIASMAGPEARLRADQETAVAALCEDAARVLVVQATGWGKSAVYWAATACRRAEGHGPTLVVSPLLSLMRDQVVAAERAGLRAATLNSSNTDAWSAVESELTSGDLDVLLVSPERLANPGFGRRVLDALAGRLGLVVIDEAHAVSDWGHDFRPDYRRVSDVLQRLHPSTPVLATTATANARVTDDVAAQLGDATLVLRGPLARASLQLSVVDPGRGGGHDRLSPLDRYAWVVDHLPTLPGSGIVYALTVADAHRLADAVAAVHPDLPVAAYTGQLEAGRREELEDALRANRLKALVATSALGMGYDKPDLGFVVHVGAPPSPVSYYQQVGRAGRALEHAHAVLLPAEADAGVWDYFATATIPVPEQVERVLAVLAGGGGAPMSVAAVEAESGVRRTRVELMLKQLAVDDVVERVEGGWLPTGKQWTHDAEHYDGVVAVRRREADIMRAYTRSERCLMQLLQESLDDPTAEPCERCSVCRGALAEGLAQRPSPETVRAVAKVLRRQRHQLEPRKMWPGGAFGSRGRIAPGELAAPGRVLVHADAPEWQEVVSDTFGRDAEAKEELRTALVGVLADWKGSWPARPEVVVDLPAAGFPRLTRSLGAHLAEVGGLDRASLLVTPPPDPRGLTSAEEAAWWRDALAGIEPPEVQDRTVLLLLDASASGWPATVAASWLARAGARTVLPLLVHRRV